MSLSAPLARRIAIVTGASAGIGLAIAEHLVTAGARVVVNARRAERLNELCARLNAGRPEPVAAAAAGDCSEQAAIDGMLATAKRSFGAAVNLVVVNAGRGLRGSVVDSDAAQWEEMIKTNLLGAARLMRAAAVEMSADLAAASAAGKPWTGAPRDIIAIGSVVGRNVSPFSSMYGSTKFGVHALAEGLRRELGPKGIRVSMIAPGFVVSEFQGVAGYDPQWFKGRAREARPRARARRRGPADCVRGVSAGAREHRRRAHPADQTGLSIMRRGQTRRPEADPASPELTKRDLLAVSGLSAKTFDTIRKAARVKGPGHGGLNWLFSLDDVRALILRAESGSGASAAARRRRRGDRSWWRLGQEMPPRD